MVISIWVSSITFFYINTIATQSVSNTDNEFCTYDLTKSITENRITCLRGKALFFPDTLFELVTFDTPQHITAEFHFAGTSEKWNNYKTQKYRQKGFGYGTYIFKLELPNTADLYGLKIKDIKSAYSVFVNGKHIGGAGKVGKSEMQMEASRYQTELFFTSASKTATVAIQVSNFHHKKGGLTGTVEVGKAEQISLHKARNIGIETFIIGALFILFIYHLAIYTYRQKDKSILYFSLLCMAMFIRLAYTGERIFLDFLSFFNWNISVRLEYIFFFLIPIFTYSFIKSLYPKDIPNWLVYISNTFCCLCILCVLVLTPAQFSHVPSISIFFLSIFSVYFLILVFKAWLRKREYSGILLLGFAFYFILSVHDVLYYLAILNTAYLMPFGLFIVTFSQAHILAQKSSSAFSRIENLTNELVKKNKDQEKIISDRTQKVNQQKHLLENKASELEIKNTQLIKLANFKQDITGMMIHDLKSPLNNIIGFSELFEKDNKFFGIIKNSGSEMINLIQNILDVDKYESASYHLNKTKIDLRDIVEQAYESTRYMIESRSILFENNIPSNHILEADKNNLVRVFLNIISNATKYCTENDVIRVSCKELNSDPRFIKIYIYNSGDDIPADKISKIFNKYTQLRGIYETESYSSGIGLTFCQLAIQAHGGEIGVKSGDQKGVEFWFTLPKN